MPDNQGHAKIKRINQTQYNEYTRLAELRSLFPVVHRSETDQIKADAEDKQEYQSEYRVMPKLGVRKEFIPTRLQMGRIETDANYNRQHTKANEPELNYRPLMAVTGKTNVPESRSLAAPLSNAAFISNTTAAQTDDSRANAPISNKAAEMKMPVLGALYPRFTEKEPLPSPLRAAGVGSSLSLPQQQSSKTTSVFGVSALQPATGMSPLNVKSPEPSLAPPVAREEFNVREGKRIRTFVVSPETATRRRT